MLLALEVHMSEEDLEVLITLDDPGEATNEYQIKDECYLLWRFT